MKRAGAALTAALARGYLVAHLGEDQLRDAWRMLHDRDRTPDVIVTLKRTRAVVRLDLAQVGGRGLSRATVAWVSRVAGARAIEAHITRLYVRFLVPIAEAHDMAQWLVQLAADATRNERAA